MINILQITPAYKPAFVYGGPTLSVAKLCEVLQTSALKVKVLTTTANGNQELMVETNCLNTVDQVNVYYFKRYTKDHTHFSPGLLIYLIKTIKQHRIKNNEKLIVHIHSWWNTVAVLSAFISLWYKIPVVISPRGMLTPYSLRNRHSLFKSVIHKSLGKHLLKHCYIHATTEKEKVDLRQIIKSLRGIYIIPNFAIFPHPSSILQPIANRKQPLKLLFLSRIEEKKGLDNLLASLSIIKISWHLTIAGDGAATYIKRLKELCEKLKIEEQITWVGEVKNHKKYLLMEDHDLLMLTSHNENFGNVVIESLSVGTAVVITEGVGLAPFVLEHQLGWVCTLQPAHLTLTITQAAADENKRKWIREHGPEIIKKSFSDQELLKNYHQMYQQIIAHGH